MDNFDLKKYLAEGRLFKEEEDPITFTLPQVGGDTGIKLPMRKIFKMLKDAGYNPEIIDGNRITGINSIIKTGWVQKTYQDIVITTNGNKYDFSWRSEFDQKNSKYGDIIFDYIHHHNSDQLDKFRPMNQNTLKTIIKISSFVLVVILLGSCGINSNMMFKTPKDGSFTYDSIPLVPKEDYKLSIDDKLVFNLTTNKGKSLLEGISGTMTQFNSSGGRNGAASSGGNLINEYIVRSDGFVELPVLGDVKVQGLTIKECEDKLEGLFESQYQDPFVQLRVTNRRCVVFSGDGNAATIVNLENINTSLLEVLAQTGGISQRGKSRIVKVMRKVGEKREIYHIDVSTIDGLKYADMIIQGNDYIYVEPRPQIIKGVVKEWAPIASLASSVTLIFTILRFTN